MSGNEDDDDKKKREQEELDAFLDKNSWEKLHEFREDSLTEFFNTLLFETPGGQRFTQDGPVLANVWLAYARQPNKPVDLILTVKQDMSTGRAAEQLRTMVDKLRGNRKVDSSGKPLLGAPDLGPLKQCEKEPIQLTYLPGQIAVRLYFDELMRVVLPLTPWWADRVKMLEELAKKYKRVAEVSYGRATESKDGYGDDELARSVLSQAAWRAKPANEEGSSLSEMPPWQHFPMLDDKMEMHEWITQGLMLMRRGMGGSSGEKEDELKARFVRKLPVDLIWLVRLSGILAHMAKGEHWNRHDSGPVAISVPDTSEPDDSEKVKDLVTNAFHVDFKYRSFDPGTEDTIDPKEADPKKRVKQERERAREAREIVAREFFDLYKNWASLKEPDGDELEYERPNKTRIWRVTRNRPAELAVQRSGLTIKADAARTLFDISCKEVHWAIVDSGIDGKHDAFKDTSEDGTKKSLASVNKSRVVRTLDFTNLRELLDPEVNLDPEFKEPGTGKENTEAAEERYERLIDILAQRKFWDEERQALYRRTDPVNSKDEEKIDLKRAKELVRAELTALHKRIRKGHDIDWEVLQPLIEDKSPARPKNDHGTHVAGILGADWIDDDSDFEILPFAQRPRVMSGICPDINLIDCRVFRDDGNTDEFEILAAVQYLRWLNSRAGYMVVHGANLSLSLNHEVRRYACGQTPICVECNESAALGMVIVAAAGNRGFETDDLTLTGRPKGFRAINITDPGNADGVITVGATHGKRPHEYGVSFFSSRGPTGDGRIKPDLVAPGEKITGPTPDGGSESKDGTSMAAPHVSGGAALLMARHKELIAQPDRIKEILCSTATDLRRDRYFQGAGLLDVLRALQSV